jgi:hypothetical protein
MSRFDGRLRIVMEGIVNHRVVLAACVISTALHPITARAQAPVPSSPVTTFPDLRGVLVPGAWVHVVERSGEVKIGKLRVLTPAGLTIVVDGESTDLAAGDIKEVRTESPAVGWWTTLAGAAAGFAVGYKIGGGSGPDNYGPVVGLVGTAVGAGVGAAVHLLTFKTTPVFREPKSHQSIKVVVAPVWTGARRGLFGAIRF